MVARRYNRNDRAFSNVAAGDRATLDVEPEGIYFRGDIIHLQGASARATEAQMAANLTNIKYLLNGIVQREASGAQMISILKWWGKTIVDGKLPLAFAQSERRTQGGEDATAMGMAGISSFQIQVDIDGAAVTPELDFRRLWQPGNVEPGLINTWFNQQVEATAAGTKRDTLDGSGRRIPAIHCFSTQINSVKVSRGDTVLIEGDKWMLDELYSDQGYVPQDDVFHISWEALTARLGDSLELKNPASGRPAALKFEFDMAAADTFDMIVEEHGIRRA